MKIYSVVKDKFVLEEKEIEALKLIGSINCSASSGCEGCPFFIPEDNYRCVRNTISNILKVQG